MGRNSRLKKQRREAREQTGAPKLPKGQNYGDLDDLTDDAELFFRQMHNQVKHGIKLAVSHGKGPGETKEDHLRVASGVSCDNCTASIKGCCYLSVSAVLFEGLPAARRLRGENRDTPEFREKLHTIGDKMESMTEAEWWETKTPCVFLSEDQRCTIYNVRPPSCRHHVVFSPPEDCVPQDPTPRTLTISSKRELNQSFAWNWQLMQSFFGQPNPEETGLIYGGAFPKIVVRLLDAIDHDDFQAALREQDWWRADNPPRMAQE